MLACLAGASVVLPSQQLHWSSCLRVAQCVAGVHHMGMRCACACEAYLVLAPPAGGQRLAAGHTPGHHRVHASINLHLRSPNNTAQHARQNCEHT